MKWRQRAKQKWLQEGDRNTKYFHKSATQRKQRNTINELYTKNSTPVSGQEEVGRLFQDFCM